MKKIAFLVLSVVLTLALARPAVAAVEITYWDTNVTPVRTPFWQHMIERFEKENPDIKVKLVGIPQAQAHTKIVTAIQTHTEPDCASFWVEWLAEFKAMDAAVDLRPYLEKSHLKNEVVPAAIEAVEYPVGGKDGPLLLIPHRFFLDGLWYRLDWYKEKGLEPPQTLVELEEQMKLFTDPAQNRYGLAMRGGKSGHLYLFQMMLTYAGANQIFDVDGKSIVNRPEYVKGLDWYTSLYKKGLTPKSAINDAYQQILMNFDSGTTALLIHNPGSSTEHKNKLGEGKFMSAPWPLGPKGVRVMRNIWTEGVGIFKTSKQKEATWKWAEFVAGEWASSYWNRMIGEIPANLRSQQHDWFKNHQYLPNFSKPIGDPKTLWFDLPSYLPEWAEFQDRSIIPDMQAVMLGQKTAKEVLDKWAGLLTEWNQAYLKRTGKK